MKKDIFTISAIYLGDDEDVFDSRCNCDYETADEAIKAAQELCKELADDINIINAFVYCGEQQDENGNVFGDPEAFYCCSNKDKETTERVRKFYGYVSASVDWYAL